jgi:hypothetical protein
MKACPSEQADSSVVTNSPFMVAVNLQPGQKKADENVFTHVKTSIFRVFRIPTVICCDYP